MGASACSWARVETVNSKDVEIKDGQGKVLRCISLETKRPHFLADAIPRATRLQGSDPTQWAMTNVQLLELFNYMQSTQEYKAAKEARGHVCLYDVNSLFVIPWSRGFGCGVALLMNAHAPLKAQVMISHAWAEDVEELVSSLSSWASRIQPLWDCDGVALWCCTFAQYQPEDGAGPSLQHQLSLDPFKSVIHSKPVHGMLVVHTTKADPYDRLWCVHEVDEALESKLFVTAIGTYSLGGRTVCTRRAKCGHAADEARIRAVIESKDGGYERLDRAIKAFRNTLLKSGASVIAEIQLPWHLYSDLTNLLLLNCKHLGLDQVCSELMEFGVERKDLFGLFTLTDSHGHKIPFKLSEIPVELSEIPLEPVELPRPLTKPLPLPLSWPCIPKQPLARQQFPLKLACALDVRYRRQRSQNEIASSSSSYTIENVLHPAESYVSRWNEMKLQHPVLCGQWTSRPFAMRGRVTKELLNILSDTALNADLYRWDFRQRDLSHFGVFLRGPEGTPYESGWFAAGIDVPNEYPCKPPKFKIFTKILHPNTGAESGEVCIDIFSANWMPALTLDKMVLSVVALLGAPEPHDPMNVEAAALQLSHPELFAEKARLWTRTYALPKPPSFRDLGIGTKSSL